MSYELLALLMLLIGAALIIAEIFIPSGGLILILCVVAFTASIWSAYKAWWGEEQTFFWLFIAGVVVVIPGAIIGTLRFLENSPIGDSVLLSTPSLDELTPYQAEIERLKSLIGKTGKALTLMTPGGMVLVEGERLHAVSEGTAIEPDETVEVIDVRGTRVVVRSIETTPPHETGLASHDEPASTPPLDFDLPQS